MPFPGWWQPAPPNSYQIFLITVRNPSPGVWVEKDPIMVYLLPVNMRPLSHSLCLLAWYKSQNPKIITPTILYVFIAVCKHFSVSKGVRIRAKLKPKSKV